MGLIDTVSPEEARKLVLEGDAYLVCAYADAERFRQMPLEGAISLEELETLAPDIPATRQLIFYAETATDETAAGRAAQYARSGHIVKVLQGGVLSWMKAGLGLLPVDDPMW